MKHSRIFPAVLAAALAVLLSGCFFKSVDELYALPKQSEGYYDLQSKIDTLMADGTEYAAPTSGANQQSVQLADLDGDGEDEAIVFLKSTSEKPLKAFIFDRVNNSFQNVAVIEGDGTSFENVEYAQVDGEPGMEIIIGRKVSDQVLRSMSVYALRDNHVVELMSENYTEYVITDLDADKKSDIFLLRFDAEQRSGVAEYYRYVGGQIEREPEALMSSGVESIKRIVAGRVTEDTPAVFVASTYGKDSIITDIFALRNGTFTNISNESATGISAQTIRNYFVYAADIDADGVIELPQPKQLPQAQSADGEDPYWIINWYNLTPSGRQKRKMTTYHNFSAGWYVILPEEWISSLTISRSTEKSGVRGLTFSRRNGEGQTPDEIFTIYAFSGDDRNKVAVEDGRFILGEKGDVTYAASLGTGGWADDLTRDELIRMFNFIHIDWNSGET